MTVQQLILNNSDKVRRDSSLMAFYIECFIEAFGYKPTCTGCTFSTDWNKLVRFISKGETITINQNKNIMSTFKLRKTTNTILFYKLNGRTFRKYDNKIDEAFAIAYLTHGTPEEIEQRKKLFAVLPGSANDIEVVENSEAPTMENTAKEIKAYAESKGIDVTGLANKKDLLEAIANATSVE